MASTDPLHDALTEVGERFALHLRADDLTSAARALQLAGETVTTLISTPEHATPRTSAIAPMPEGLLLRIDDLSARIDTRRRLAEAVREAQAQTGLSAAPVAVVLRLFPEPAGSAGRLDPAWIDRIGEPVDWLTTSEVRKDVRADGWALLEPVLLLDDHLDDALIDAGAPPIEATLGPTVSEHGVPELDSIVIEAEPHPRRGTRLTVLELAAWLAGGTHTDEPATVSPVLTLYVRHLGLGLDHARRQRLKQTAIRLVGTDGDDDADRARAWQLTDWLVRTHAPPWLRRAGLTESADRLDGLASITGNADLVRAVDLLGNAIVTASRRLEITTAIAGTRAEIETSTHGLGDAIWSAALQEIATAAWRGAWAASETFVHHESTFSIRTAMRRSLESELGPGEDMGVELLIDEVDTAVRDVLAHLVLAEVDEPDFWNRAVDAASVAERGAVWRRALDGTRSVLGAALFDEAIAVARAELHRWLDEAPRTVGRAVAAAVAREASGVAGRGIAARAAAESLARGGSDGDAEDAAHEVLAEIVDELADDALRMIDVLVDAEPIAVQDEVGSSA